MTRKRSLAISPSASLLCSSRHARAFAMLMFLSGCSAPPIQFFTLSTPASGTQTLAPLSAPVLSVTRVTVPDYLDTQDITTRQGDKVERSANARWASRLSIAVTDFLTEQLAHDEPGYFVTAQQLLASPSTLRLSINITRLDVEASGQATLIADWTFIPANEHAPVRRQQGVFSANGTVASDGGTVNLTKAIIAQLEQRIAATTPRP